MKLGIYKHYKGKEYLVIGIARHSETQEYFVVYVPLYKIEDGGGIQMAIRPEKMFNEEISPGVRRFTYIGE